jgi:hypothetical protein
VDGRLFIRFLISFASLSWRLVEMEAWLQYTTSSSLELGLIVTIHTDIDLC